MQLFRDDVITAYVDGATRGPAETWEIEELFTALGELYNPTITAEDLIDDVGGQANLTRETLLREIRADADLAYDTREEELGEEATRELERRVVLSVIDKRWREHLYEMDYLKNGIGLRAMAQRDPLVEYQREGFEMFNSMQEGIKEDVVRLTSTLEVKVKVNPGEDLEDPSDDVVEVDAEELRPRKPQLQLSAPSDSGGVQVRSDSSGAAAAPEEAGNRAQRRAKKR